MESFLKRAEAMKSELVECRRHLHTRPEIGMELPETAGYIKRKLEALGLEPRIMGGSGVTAVIGGKRPGKTFLLRADMDALDMSEESGLPFASQTKYAHTCGHDLHAAMLFGAAKLLKEQEDQICGSVKLMFQPGEECFAGAQAMIEAGILDNPKVDAAMGMHIMLDGPLGSLSYGEGFMSSSCDGFRITITGKGAHGAMPETGIDPINVGVHLHLAMQELIAREVSPRQTAVLTIGEFSAGATPNIIPEKAVLQGTLRTYDAKVRAHLVERLREVVDLTARTFRAKAEYEVLSDVPSIYSDPRLLGELLPYLQELGPLHLLPNARLTPSEDFALVAKRVPSVYFLLNAPVTGSTAAHHNPKVLFHEDILPLGAAAYAQCASQWLSDHR